MRLVHLIIIIIMIIAAPTSAHRLRPHIGPTAAQLSPLPASTESAKSAVPQLPLPPPTANFSIAVLSPIDHTRKVVTQPVNDTVQAAPYSPLAVYVATNTSVILSINNEEQEINGSGTREILSDNLGAGIYYTIRSSARNSSILLYVLTPGQEDDLKEALKPPQMDPWRIKRIRAVISAILAVLLGVPFGVRLREKISSKTRRGKVEEL